MPPRLRPRAATVKLTVRGSAHVQLRVSAGTAIPRTSIKPPPLVVTLPDINTVPEVWRGARYVLRRLLGSGDSNPKLRKSNAAGTPFQTWGLAMAPARESGYQLCSSSSAACRVACLYRQGHSRADTTIAACRIAKAVAWKEHRDWFVQQLTHELRTIERRADRDGFEVAVRLNLTSDVMWEREIPELFSRFTTFQAYDYTKHFPRMMRYTRGDLPPNYHLTFSRSEDNEMQCREVLAAGGNVAIVFRSRQFPPRYLGFPVIDGDETDLRFLDPSGVVVALSAKGTAKSDDTGFVVDSGRFSLKIE